MAEKDKCYEMAWYDAILMLWILFVGVYFPFHVLGWSKYVVDHFSDEMFIVVEYVVLTGCLALTWYGFQSVFKLGRYSMRRDIEEDG